jgi:hypothetical protein
MGVTTAYDVWRCPACGIRLSVASPGPSNLVCGCTMLTSGGTRMIQLGRRIAPVGLGIQILDTLLVDCGDYQLRVEPSWQ